MDLRTTAVAYARRGWPVFPCQPGRKIPATRHGLHDATIDLDRVDRYWHKRPECNIGIRTGDVFDVLDLDGPEGVDHFRRWADRHGVDASHVSIQRPTRLGVATPRGIHVYCQPTGSGNRAGMLGPGSGIDWRGKGGYVVAAGSRRPDGLYWWLDLAGAAPLWQIPPELAQLVSPPLERHEPGVAYRYTPQPDADPRGTAYGTAALRAEASAVAAAVKGTRNHQLNAAAFSIYQLVEGGELDDSHATAELMAAAAACGLGEREVAQTIQSARRGAAGRPRNAPPKT